MRRRVAAVERVLGALADHGGGGHVAAGLTEHAVVQHDAGDVLAARGRVQHFLEALVHHVAVALHGEHDRVGLGPLDAGGQRRRAAVQRLEDLDVEVVGERGVATDAEHRDGALDHVELGDRFERRAHRDRLAATGTEVVLPQLDERRREVVDEPRRLRGWRVRGNHEMTFDAVHQSSTSSIRARSVPTSRSGAMPNPELSRLSPPMKWTGQRPRTARRTSSII